MSSGPMRRFSGIVWLDGRQERLSLMAPSRKDALVMLKARYGTEREFRLTDEEAANRPR